VHEYAFIRIVSETLYQITTLVQAIW